MEKNVLFTNETSVEVVTSFAAVKKERSHNTGAMTIIAAVIMVVFSCAMIYFVPIGAKFAVAFIVFIVMAAVLIKLFRGDNTESSGTSGLGLASTGEKKLWRYSFFDDRIEAECGSDRLDLEYSGIESVRDIGSGFQIKHPEGRVTIKKSGFSEGGEERFRQLMKSKNLTIY